MDTTGGVDTPWDNVVPAEWPLLAKAVCELVLAGEPKGRASFCSRLLLGGPCSDDEVGVFVVVGVTPLAEGLTQAPPPVFVDDEGDKGEGRGSLSLNNPDADGAGELLPGRADGRQGPGAGEVARPSADGVPCP